MTHLVLAAIALAAALAPSIRCQGADGLADLDWHAQVRVLDECQRRIAADPADREPVRDAIAALATLSWSLDGDEWAPPGPFLRRAAALSATLGDDPDPRVLWLAARSGRLRDVAEKLPAGDGDHRVRALRCLVDRDWRRLEGRALASGPELTALALAYSDCGRFDRLAGADGFDGAAPRGLIDDLRCRSRWTSEDRAGLRLARMCVEDAASLLERTDLPAEEAARLRADLGAALATGGSGAELAAAARDWDGVDGTAFGAVLGACDRLRRIPPAAGQLVSGADLAQWLYLRGIHAGWQQVRLLGKSGGYNAVNRFLTGVEAGDHGIAARYLRVRNAIDANAGDTTDLQRELVELVAGEGALGERALPPSFLAWCLRAVAKRNPGMARETRPRLDALLKAQRSGWGHAGILQWALSAQVLPVDAQVAKLLAEARSDDPQSFALATARVTEGAAADPALLPVTREDRIADLRPDLGRGLGTGPLTIVIAGEVRVDGPLHLMLNASGAISLAIDGHSLRGPPGIRNISAGLPIEAGWHRLDLSVANEAGPAAVQLVLSQLQPGGPPGMAQPGQPLAIGPDRLRGMDGKPGLVRTLRLMPVFDAEDPAMADYLSHLAFADHPWRLKSRRVVAEALLFRGDRAGALAAFERLVADAPEDADAVVDFARASAASGGIDRALAALEAFAGKAPFLQAALARRTQAEIAWAAGRHAEALGYDGSAAQTGQYLSLTTLARRQVAMGLFAKAAETYGQAASSYDDDDPKAAAAACRYLAGATQFAQLREELQDADQCSGWFSQGAMLALGVLGQEGSGGLDTLLAEYPGGPAAKGLSLLADGRPAEAVPQLVDSTRTRLVCDAEAQDLAYLLARTLAPAEQLPALSRRMRALADLEGMIRSGAWDRVAAIGDAAPQRANARLCLAVHELAAGRADAARAALAQAGTDPRGHLAARICARLLAGIGDAQKAQRFVAAQPGTPPASR